MMADARSVLERAKFLSRAVPDQLSVDLAPVFDAHAQQLIEPWRNNGHIVEHPLHRMMPRVGGFPPSLARYFIAAYSRPGDHVLDPYCGKGTVLFEATKMARRALGGDVAPDAVVATRAKCARVSIAKVANYIQGLDADSCTTVTGVPGNVQLFFRRNTLRQILSVREQILADMCSSGNRLEVATFVCGVMLGILHGHSRYSLSLPCNQCFAMSPKYVERYANEHRLQRPNRDVRQCLLAKSMELLPHPQRAFSARVFEAPAEECVEYLGGTSGQVALVITSPPYLNRQTYSKDAWLRLWFLNRDYKEVAKRSLETGSIPVFVAAIEKSLAATGRTLVTGGVVVLIGGQARVNIGGIPQSIRINDLCLYALERINRSKRTLVVNTMIRDRKIMTRGSYFAVHAGKYADENGLATQRYGDEDILVLTKT